MSRSLSRCHAKHFQPRTCKRLSITKLLYNIFLKGTYTICRLCGSDFAKFSSNLDIHSETVVSEPRPWLSVKILASAFHRKIVTMLPWTGSGEVNVQRLTIHSVLGSRLLDASSESLGGPW